MMYTPFLKELLCGFCSELRATICYAFVRMLNVTNVHRRQSVSPFEQSCTLSIIGQLEYLSTTMR